MKPTPRAVENCPATARDERARHGRSLQREPVKLADYRGRWLLLFFYPLGFTFVCPTELRGFSERIQDFEKEGVSVPGVSVDSVHTHRGWIEAPKDKGGLGELRFPLASDNTHRVSKDYGVDLSEAGHALVARSSSIRRACCVR